MDRREFVQAAGAAGIGAALFPGLAAEAYADAGRQRIEVNVPTYETRLYSPDGELVKEYPCEVGKPETPTPIGDGEVFHKNGDGRFYDDDGELITETEIKPEGKTIDVPYDRIKALWFTVNGRMTGPIFHSTTWYWTIGTPFSDGCVNLYLNDMEDLYDRVEEPLPDLDVTYETMFVDEDEDNLIMWADIYDRGTNNVENLSQMLDREIPVDDETLRKRLDAIDWKLDRGHEEVREMLENGEDPRPYREKLRHEVSLDFLLDERRII